MVKGFGGLGVQGFGRKALDFFLKNPFPTAKLNLLQNSPEETGLDGTNHFQLCL